MATKDTPGTDLATFDPEQSRFPVLFQSEDGGGIAEVIADNFGDEGFQANDLDRVKIPAAGGAYWEVPDEAPAKELEGVIVAKQKTRSYWETALGDDGAEEGQPPDCASPDAVIGQGVFGPGSPGNPTGLCEHCPMNVFGSGKGNSKACKEAMNIYMLREGSILPLHVSLPPTSLKDFRRYMTRLAAKGVSYYAVVTKLGLRQETGPAGKFSIAVPARGDDLAPEEKAAAKQYGQTISGSLRAAQLQREAAAQQTTITASTTETVGAS